LSEVSSLKYLTLIAEVGHASVVVASRLRRRRRPLELARRSRELSGRTMKQPYGLFLAALASIIGR
jgi:hypothetical protein